MGQDGAFLTIPNAAASIENEPHQGVLVTEDHSSEQAIVEIKPLKSTYHDIVSIDRVDQLYGQLTDVVGSLSSKVGNVLKKQEDLFLREYQTHLERLLVDMANLKKQLQLSEDKLKQDQRVATLQQERDWFQKESIRLDETTRKQSAETSLLREENANLEEERNWLESQLKKARRQNKLLKHELEIFIEDVEKRKVQMEGSICNVKNEVLQKHLVEAQLDGQHDNRQRKVMTPKSMSAGKISPTHQNNAETDEVNIPERPLTSSTTRKSTRINEIENNTCLCTDANCKCKKLNGRLTEQLQLEKKKIVQLQAQLVSDDHSQSKIQKLFLTCVKEVKADISRRKFQAKFAHTRYQLRNEEDYYQDLYKMKSRQETELTSADKKRIISTFFLQDEVFGAIFNQIFKSGHDHGNNNGKLFPNLP